MVAGSFVIWNSDEHLDGVPSDLRNSVPDSLPGYKWFCLRKDISVVTEASSSVRASEGTPCIVVAGDVDANLAASYGTPRN